MGLLDALRPKSQAEQIRENKRMLDRAIRELERERLKIEAQEKKTIADMKRAAKVGQKVSTNNTHLFYPFLSLILGSLQDDGQGCSQTAQSSDKVLQDACPAQQCLHANAGFKKVFHPSNRTSFKFSFPFSRWEVRLL